MRLILVLCLTLFPLAATAQAAKETYTFERGQTSARPDQDDAIQHYVNANITETFFHELGHAIIDVAGVPIFGMEEWAADIFAIVLLNRLFDEDEVQRIARDVAANYYEYASEAPSSTDRLDLWGIHGLDMQRYFNFACLIYGANPDERADLAGELDLPEARATTCESEFEQADRSWGDVLDNLGRDAPGDTLRLDWVVDADDPLTLHVSGLVERLNAVMALPEAIMVSVIPCGQSNAFYDPDLREIQICTELGEELARNAR